MTDIDTRIVEIEALLTAPSSTTGGCRMRRKWRWKGASDDLVCRVHCHHFRC